MRGNKKLQEKSYARYKKLACNEHWDQARKSKVANIVFSSTV